MQMFSICIFAYFHIRTFTYMEISNLIPHIEALIFASDKPLTSLDITELVNSAFGFMEDKVTLDQVEASVEGIVEKYNSEFYPFEVKQSGGGWQFLTKKEFHKTIAQLNGEKFLKRLSAAALETLAIIAYKQPITKGEIETIRGVSTDYTIQKLLEKELIVISGRNEALPGHPLIYNTSKSFMDYFGVNSAEDLPKIKEVLANQIIEGTVIGPNDFVQPSSLAVTGNGELIDEASDAEVDENIENSEEENCDVSIESAAEETNENSLDAFDEESPEIDNEEDDNSFQDPDSDEPEENDSAADENSDEDSTDDEASSDERQ
jgi:segregation and condensation protein B